MTRTRGGAGGETRALAAVMRKGARDTARAPVSPAHRHGEKSVVTATAMTPASSVIAGVRTTEGMRAWSGDTSRGHGGGRTRRVKAAGAGGGRRRAATDGGNPVE